MNAPLGDVPQTLTGLQVVDVDGAKVGTVQQVYRDDATNEPEWITVRTGLFGLKETFIPLAGARRTGDELHVPHTKETIKKAPRIDEDGHLDPSQETELYRHYGLIRPSGTDASMPAGPRPGTAAGTPPATPGERNKLFERPMAGAGTGERAREGRTDSGDIEQTPEAPHPGERRRMGGPERPGREGPGPERPR
ncbi:PRC-barrel domain-containing protein [Streptomyces sp. NPDC021749]|uniref:PRC-barrel domain-containing protein n=1 Tax=Streptomyces sp. NPDC021749 TaxID=3154905 RepID=UPI0033DEC0EA